MQAKEVKDIYKATPYILMIGIFLVVLDGLWIVDTYDLYAAYPKEAFITLMLGISLTMLAYMLIQRKRKQVAQIESEMLSNSPAKGSSHQHLVNKIWKQRVSVGNKLVGVLLVILALIAIFDFGIAVSLLGPILFLGMLGVSFVYIMKEEEQGIHEEDLQPKGHRLRNLLRLIDYREHPFSLALILFMLIVLTFLLSKRFGLVLSLETSGNPLYVMSLPNAAFLLSGLIFACGFQYIHQHCDFFGIRRAEQGEYKLILIHFIEIIICGASFLIWLMILMIDLFTG